MSNEEHIRKYYNEAGEYSAVLISRALWEAAGSRLQSILTRALTQLEPSQLPEEPYADWDEFRQWWDFAYPFNAEVQCLHCNATSADWTQDTPKQFHLKSAQLGGLVVFHCLSCQSTVRKKHFKDHICFEVSPAKQD